MSYLDFIGAGIWFREFHIVEGSGKTEDLCMFLGQGAEFLKP